VNVGRRLRRPSALLFLVGSVLLVVGSFLGYLAGTAVRSPAQVLADTAPPGASVLTEPVTSTRVIRSVTFEGTVVRRFSQEITAPSLLGDDGVAVVSRLPRRGAKLAAGSVAAEVSGRPVIVLRGTLPAYRTLAPGSSGPDVAQLQTALVAAGHPVTDARGSYGPSTTAAVGDLYRRNGYEPSTVGDDEVATAKDGIRSTERALEQLRSQPPVDPLALKFANEDVMSARAALAEAEAKAGVEVPLGEVAFVPELPAVVTDIKAGVGQVAEGGLFTLTSGELVVRGAPAQVDARRIRPGQAADLLIDPVGQTPGRVTGTTKIVASDTDDTGGEGDRSFTIATRKHLPDRAAGAAVRVTVAVGGARARALTVPVSAVSRSSSGKSTVLVVRAGASDPVEVVPGFVGDGLVQVRPLVRDALSKGDQVAVGVGP
jgi:HlyD family secretion protein